MWWREYFHDLGLSCWRLLVVCLFKCWLDYLFFVLDPFGLLAEASRFQISSSFSWIRWCRVLVLLGWSFGELPWRCRLLGCHSLLELPLLVGHELLVLGPLLLETVPRLIVAWLVSHEVSVVWLRWLLFVVVGCFLVEEHSHVIDFVR